MIKNKIVQTYRVVCNYLFHIATEVLQAASFKFQCLHLHSKDWTLNHLKNLIKKIAIAIFLSLCTK